MKFQVDFFLIKLYKNFFHNAPLHIAILNDHIEIVKLLLENEKQNINLTNVFNYSFVFYLILIFQCIFRF